MSKIQYNIHLIILSYLRGTATLDEKLKLQEWLKSSPENATEFLSVKKLWDEGDSTYDTNTEAALSRLKSRIRIENNNSSVQRNLSRYWSRIAAVFLLLVGLGTGLLISPSAEKKETIVQNQLITAKGSKGEFTLPDGSIVWLNSGSRLIYPETFNNEIREVILEGGGYFDIVKDTERPFIVCADEFKMEVLGTSFTISSYSGMETVEVALVTGGLKVSGPISENVILHPNQVFEYNKEVKEVTVKTIDAQYYKNWISNKLVFDNDRLTDIINSLEGWYNIKIVCPESYASNTRLSFTVRDEEIEEVLKTMSMTIPVTYSKERDKFIVKPLK